MKLNITVLVLAALTAIHPAWIELLTGWDPDHGSGSLELAITVIAAVVAVAAATRLVRALRQNS